MNSGRARWTLLILRPGRISENQLNKNTCLESSWRRLGNHCGAFARTLPRFVVPCWQHLPNSPMPFYVYLSKVQMAKGFLKRSNPSKVWNSHRFQDLCSGSPLLLAVTVLVVIVGIPLFWAPWENGRCIYKKKFVGQYLKIQKQV